MKKSAYYFGFLLVIIAFLTPVSGIAQTDKEPSLNLSLAGSYLSRFVAYGLDMAGESAALRGAATISHSSGIYADVYYTAPTDNAIENAQQGLFDVGYETEFGDIFSFYAEYARYFYNSDSINILSQYSGSISLNAGVDLSVLELGLSYDRFLGDNGATYFSIDLSSFFEAGPVYIMPMLQMVFMSQTIEDKYLGGGKGKKGKDDPAIPGISTTVTGLSTSSLTGVVVYPVATGLSLSFVPSLIFYHKEELSVESTLFIWNAGLRYSFDL